MNSNVRPESMARITTKELADAFIAEQVEAQVRANLIQGNATREPAKAAVRPIAISADDFDDED